HQAVDGAVDNPVLQQQQGDLKIHVQYRLRPSSGPRTKGGAPLRAPLALSRRRRAPLRSIDVQGVYFQAPFSTLTMTRALWSRPRWSVLDIVKMPCAPATPLICS